MSTITIFVSKLKQRFFLISWISLVIYLFYESFVCYKNGRQFFRLRQILGLGLCISRGTATVLNVCSALVLLPLCKKLNHTISRVVCSLWPALFFFWLERAKSFHMTVGITLFVFAVIHSVSHFVNLLNFSRGYDEAWKDINLATYKNENPLCLLLNQAGLTGVLMLAIVICMGVTSSRLVRKRVYNAFWYTHHLYLPFMVLLLLHPLSGALKEEVLEESYSSHIASQLELSKNISSFGVKFVPIQSKTHLYMFVPLACFALDLIWRIFTRNLARVDILKVIHMPGQTISLTMSSPEKFRCKMGQYILLQCPRISLLEWHPFTVVKLHPIRELSGVGRPLRAAVGDVREIVEEQVLAHWQCWWRDVRIPNKNKKSFIVWIRVKGDWTEALEQLLKESDDVCLFVDGPFSSPMEGVSRSNLAICVAAGVGITPFVPVLRDLVSFPKNQTPGRIHLIWIVRYEREITWLADLANKCILHLRDANRPDRLLIEFFVTSKEIDIPIQPTLTQVVIVNEKSDITECVVENCKSYEEIEYKKDDAGSNRVDKLKMNSVEKETLLTPKCKRSNIGKLIDNELNCDGYEIAKEYPILGCRVRRGKPHWDRVFGYWMHLYPRDHLDLYCCGPKKLVKLLRKKCHIISATSKTKFTFMHEGFA